MSPLSVLYALGMAANGMDGETLAQAEQVLGAPVADVNAYLHALDQSLAEPYVATGAAGSIGGANVAGTTEGAGGDADATGGAADAGAAASPLKLANALWIRDGFEVEQAFLQTNADYYAAGAFRAAFDQGTARDINAWVSENTDGMVENLIGEIPAEAVLYLVNALAFDADWASPYTEDAVRDGTFAAADGTAQEARMMFSTEHHYLEDGEAVGFVKPYAYEESPFAFAAILPPRGHVGAGLRGHARRRAPAGHSGGFAGHRGARQHAEVRKRVRHRPRGRPERARDARRVRRRLGGLRAPVAGCQRAVHRLGAAQGAHRRGRAGHESGAQPRP